MAHTHNDENGQPFEHEHDQAEHDHDGCSPGKDYERNIQEQRQRTVSRRTMLRTMSAMGLAAAGGGLGVTNVAASSVDFPTSVQPTPFVSADNDGFLYLSGDHHIHSHYSPDAKYPVQKQVSEANRYGLDWMVVTDHGNATHNKLGVDLTYPDVIKSRSVFKNILLFTGYEMNIPGAEHGTVIMMPGDKELANIKDFEKNFDGDLAPNVEETMLASLRYLDKLDPKPIFFANHPARRGLDSPHEMRNWKLTAPEVVWGFEGAPGHQMAGMITDADGKYVSYRGFYGNKPGGTGAHTFYGPETYMTYGGYDWMTAKLGGLWDSMLGDGLRWWITANSDSHKYFADLQDINSDSKEFEKNGFVTEIDNFFLQPVYGDFAPGQYSRTYVVTNDRSYAGVMAGIRQGNMFVVTGDLIDRLRFYVSGRAPGEKDFGGVGVLTGGTFVVKAGSDIRVQVRLQTPKKPNANNERPRLDHFDLIAGQMLLDGYKQGNADLMSNPTTKVVQTYGAGDWKATETATSYIIETEYVYKNVQQNFYTRLRGTNTKDYGATPAMDVDMRGKTGPSLSPWESLWFYSNPIFVLVQ